MFHLKSNEAAEIRGIAQHAAATSWFTEFRVRKKHKALVKTKELGEGHPLVEKPHLVSSVRLTVLNREGAPAQLKEVLQKIKIAKLAVGITEATTPRGYSIELWRPSKARLKRRPRWENFMRSFLASETLAKAAALRRKLSVVVEP